MSELSLTQSLRRLGQQMNGKRLFDSIDAGSAQYKLLKKLYAQNGLRLDMTCMACPEQYDVFKDDKPEQVAYYRLRHGGFTVDYPNVGAEQIYGAYTNGDGCFEPDERLKFMTIAMRKLLEKINLEK